MGWHIANGKAFHMITERPQPHEEEKKGIRYLRFQPYQKKYYAEEGVSMQGRVFLVCRAEDGAKVAKAIGTREAAERIAAIYEEDGV